jgi:predicted Rossmann-fold nucleotide-binding protein
LKFNFYTVCCIACLGKIPVTPDYIFAEQGGEANQEAEFTNLPDAPERCIQGFKENNDRKDDSLDRSVGVSDSPYTFSSSLVELKVSNHPLKADSPHYHFDSYIADKVAQKWLKSTAGYGFVSLLLPDLPTDRDGNSNYTKAIVGLINYVKEKNYNVIYDADASSAAIVRDLMGEHAIGITGKSLDTPLWNSEHRVLRVLNPYLRLLAFQSAQYITVAKGSATGIATIANGTATHYTLMGAQVKGDSYFRNWRPNFSEPSLGFTIASPLKLRLETRLYSQPPKDFNLNSALRNLFAFETAEIQREANLFQNSLSKLSLQRNDAPAGAVIFGSSSRPGNYSDLVYKVAWTLAREGLPVSTGGAGGVMEIANQGAYNAGGESIGINLGGRLATERETVSSVQTRSLSVSSYDQRIPLLLKSKRLVIFAPGGSGTLKELGTTLLLYQEERENPDLVFLGEYYQPLVQGLREILPPSINSKIHLVKSIAEFELIYRELADYWLASGLESSIRDRYFSYPIRVDQPSYLPKISSPSFFNWGDDDKSKTPSKEYNAGDGKKGSKKGPAQRKDKSTRMEEEKEKETGSDGSLFGYMKRLFD